MDSHIDGMGRIPGSLATLERDMLFLTGLYGWDCSNSWVTEEFVGCRSEEALDMWD